MPGGNARVSTPKAAMEGWDMGPEPPEPPEHPLELGPEPEPEPEQELLEPEPEPELETDDDGEDEEETLEQLTARLAVPLLPMLAPVAPAGPRPAKQRTTGFLKTNKVADQALQALSLPGIAERRAPLPPPPTDRRRGAQTERVVRRVRPVVDDSPATEKPAARAPKVAAAAARTAKARPHTDRTRSSPPNRRVAELETRGFLLLAARVKEEQAAAAAAEGREAEQLNKSLEKFFGHMNKFWTRESEAQMIEYLDKHSPRHTARKPSRQQLLERAMQKRDHEMHKKRVSAARPVIDVASPREYQHHKVNRKKLQMEKEQRQELARQNRISKQRVAEARTILAEPSDGATAATPRRPKKPVVVASSPGSGGKRLSMTGKADPHDMRKAATDSDTQQEAEAEAESETAAPDDAMLGVGPETKAWMKKMKRACTDGDLSLLNRALEYVDASTNLSGGWPPLSLAAAAGHAEVVKELLKQGADAKRGQPPSAIELAANSGHVECVQALLMHSTHQHLSDACQQAASGGHLGAVRRLLDFNSALLFDLTHSALQNVCEATEEHELDFGEVRPKLRVWYKRLKARLQTIDGLEAASKVGDVELLRPLLKNPGWRVGDLDRCFASGWTALGSAAVAGHCDAVQLLLEAGAKPSAKMSDGYDAMEAAMQNEGSEEAVAMLLPWLAQQEQASKHQAKSRFKEINKRAVNKQCEKHTLIGRIRAGNDDPGKAPWYKTSGGRPPKAAAAAADPVRARAEEMSTRAMRNGRHKKKKKNSRASSPTESVGSSQASVIEIPSSWAPALKFEHGAAAGLVSAISVKDDYESELRSKGVDPSSSIPVFASIGAGSGVPGERAPQQLRQQQQRQQQQQEEVAVPVAPGMRKWRVGDNVV